MKPPQAGQPTVHVALRFSLFQRVATRHAELLERSRARIASGALAPGDNAATKLVTQRLLVARFHIKIIRITRMISTLLGSRLAVTYLPKGNNLRPIDVLVRIPDERSEYVLLASKSKELC